MPYIIYCHYMFTVIIIFVVLSITEKPGQLLVYCYYIKELFCVLPETKRTRCIVGRSRTCCGRSTTLRSRIPAQKEDMVLNHGVRWKHCYIADKLLA